jgi:hypothetical protein
MKTKLKLFVCLMLVAGVLAGTVSANAITGVFIGDHDVNDIYYDFYFSAHLYYNYNNANYLDIYSMVTYITNDGTPLENDYYYAQDGAGYDEANIYRTRGSVPTGAYWARHEVFWSQVAASTSYNKTLANGVITHIGVVTDIFGVDLTTFLRTIWTSSGYTTQPYGYFA